MGRVGCQRRAVASLGFGRTREHLQYQRAVGERSGAGGARGAVEYLTKEHQRPGRIALHREGGGGGGANPGRDPVTARLQNTVEERRRRGRIATPQPHVGQPTSGAQGGTLERFAGRRDQGREDLGGGRELARLQMRPRHADVEGRIPRVASRSRPPDADCLHDIAPVEQQSHQFYPAVPT